MNRDEASLLDIYNATQRILLFAADLDPVALAASEEKQSAILYQVMILGEATIARTTRETLRNPLEKHRRNAGYCGSPV
jgi:uncharacterized protein with HEPN domain